MKSPATGGSGGGGDGDCGRYFDGWDGRARRARRGGRDCVECEWTISCEERACKLLIQLPDGLEIEDDLLFFSVLKEDHLAVKLQFQARGDRQRTTSIPPAEAVARGLLAQDRVSFFCKQCKQPILEAPIRKCVELPSAEWMELADNWYCGGCCGRGARAHAQVQHARARFVPSQGTCLIGRTSCLIHVNDLSSKLHRGQLGHGATQTPDEYKGEADKLQGRGLSDVCVQASLGQDQKWSGRTHEQQISSAAEEQSHGLASHCCTSIPCFADEQRVELLAKAMERQEVFPPESRTLQVILCDCSTPIGFWQPMAELREGVHLVHHRLLSQVEEGFSSSQDPLKSCTMETVLASELVAAADDDLGNHFVIRGLQTGTALLQVVLISKETRKCWGQLLQYSGEQQCPEARSRTDSSNALRAAAKVMFKDCSTMTASEMRSVEDWAAKCQAEDITIMAEDYIKISECLKVHSEELPLSCRRIGDFTISFLEYGTGRESSK
eukprot:SM000004S15109  [mRNA]  locus=s4:1230249:1232846:- [translate_table: standard]